MNIVFDLTYIYVRAKLYGLIDERKLPLWRFLREKPFVDLKPTLVVLNNFKFGAFSEPIEKRKRKHVDITGDKVPSLVLQERFKEVENYIIAENKAFLEVLKEVASHLQKLKPRLSG